MRLLALTLLTAALGAGAAAAACPDAATVDAFLADRAAARPAAPPVPAGGSLDDAYCAQAMIVERLTGTEGAVVGWKAGLTSAPAQAAFGVSEPVLGTLLAGMMLADGAAVSPAAAVRALFEADLVVEIGDAAVNGAATPAEVLPHIRGVRPFMELPALLVSPDHKLDGAAITSINVGAWKGVLGDLVAIPATDAGVLMLAAFTARLSDETGAEISAAPGTAVLEHPLNAVIWAARALAKQGKALAPGDLVSVGSFGPLHPMTAGRTVTLTYDGLPGTPTVSARFE